MLQLLLVLAAASATHAVPCRDEWFADKNATKDDRMYLGNLVRIGWSDCDCDAFEIVIPYAVTRTGRSMYKLVNEFAVCKYKEIPEYAQNAIDYPLIVLHATFALDNGVVVASPNKAFPDWDGKVIRGIKGFPINIYNRNDKNNIEVAQKMAASRWTNNAGKQR